MFDPTLAARIDDALAASDLMTDLRRAPVADLRRAILAIVASCHCGPVADDDTCDLGLLVETRIHLWRSVGWPAVPAPRERATA